MGSNLTGLLEKCKRSPSQGVLRESTLDTDTESSGLWLSHPDSVQLQSLHHQVKTLRGDTHCRIPVSFRPVQLMLPARMMSLPFSTMDLTEATSLDHLPNILTGTSKFPGRDLPPTYFPRPFHSVILRKQNTFPVVDPVWPFCYMLCFRKTTYSPAGKQLDSSLETTKIFRI